MWISSVSPARRPSLSESNWSKNLRLLVNTYLTFDLFYYGGWALPNFTGCPNPFQEWLRFRALKSSFKCPRQMLPMGDLMVSSLPDPFVLVEDRRRLHETHQDRELRMSMGARPNLEETGHDEEGSLHHSRRLGSNYIIFSHGYCAESNEFEGYGVGTLAQTHGRSSKFLRDPLANRRVHEFADLLKALGPVGNGDSCGIIAHSQGGLAALYLYSSYKWSCLDNASSGRKIQFVGSPYQGSPMSSTVSFLADIFGILCGYNYDLSQSSIITIIVYNR